LDTTKRQGQIHCIHGIRFWSMLWVLIGHSYAAIDNSAPAINRNDLYDEFQEGFMFRLILNGFPSVDSFFIIGGCLLTFLTFQEMEKKRGKLNVPLFYLQRYMRVAAVYAIVIYANVTIWKWTERGPATNAKIGVKKLFLQSHTLGSGGNLQRFVVEEPAVYKQLGQGR